MSTLPLIIEIDAKHEVSAKQIESVISELSTYTALGKITLTRNDTREVTGEKVGYLRLSTSTTVQDGSEGLTNRKSKNLSNRVWRAVVQAQIEDKAYGWEVDRLALIANR